MKAFPHQEVELHLAYIHILGCTMMVMMRVNVILRMMKIRTIIMMMIYSRNCRRLILPSLLISNTHQ